MYRKSISRVTSTYQRSLSGREVLGTLIGEKRAQNSFSNWLWAPNKRSRTSFRDVWVCADCNGSSSILSAPGIAVNHDPTDQAVIGIAFIICIAAVSILALSGPQPAPSSEGTIQEEVSADKAENQEIYFEGNDSGLPAIEQSNTTNSPYGAEIFSVQVASFSEIQNVENTETLLRRLGLVYRREAVIFEGGPVFRVMVIGTANDNPEFILELLRNNGYSDAFVRFESE